MIPDAPETSCDSAPPGDKRVLAAPEPAVPTVGTGLLSPVSSDVIVVADERREESVRAVINSPAQTCWA